MPAPPLRAPKSKTPRALPVDATILFWVGRDDPHTIGATYVPGVPARDLSEHDLARRIFKSSAKTITGDSPEYAAARDTLATFLLGTGLYSKVKEATPEAPAETPGAPAADSPAKE